MSGRGQRKAFSQAEWDAINAELDRDPQRYGVPARVFGSAVLGSFNIRKLGAARRRSAATWRFLGRLCRSFDLLAVQEVMDDLSGLYRLVAEMGPEFELIVSDKTGAFPGDRGLNERLAFVYRSAVVHRGPIASDVTYDRTKIHSILLERWDEIAEAVARHRERVDRYERGLRRTRPKLELPVFLSFIRQPYAVAFQIIGHPGVQPYRFIAVNAHLIFGALEERKREFSALMEWVLQHARQASRGDFPGLILLGDLNLDFDNPATDISDIQRYLNSFDNRDGDEVSVWMPFLEPHPRVGQVLRTNARMRETFDHIGLFFPTERVPPHVRQAPVARDPRGPDYGVINFVELFCRATEGVSFKRLPKRRRKGFYARFEHKVSDHMPIWLRVPLPE